MRVTGIAEQRVGSSAGQEAFARAVFGNLAYPAAEGPVKENDKKSDVNQNKSDNERDCHKITHGLRLIFLTLEQLLVTTPPPGNPQDPCLRRSSKGPQFERSKH